MNQLIPEINRSLVLDQFHPIIGNRTINQKKVEKIAKDIQEGFNMLPYFPILVTEPADVENYYLVIDGQHRLEAARLAGEEVYYIIGNHLSPSQIARINSKAEKWKPTDFLNCYIKLGNTDYQEIIYFMKTYKGIAIKTVIDLLHTNTHHAGGTTTEIFQNGDFKANYITETTLLLDSVFEVFGRYKFCFDRNLIGAMMKLQKVGKCDFDELKSKISMNPNGMDKNSTVKQYLDNIERVYNFKNSLRRTIF